MSFWDTYDDRPVQVHPGYEHLAKGRAAKPSSKAPPARDPAPPHPKPSAINAPAMCFECGHLGADVLFGCCQACFDIWSAAHATPPNAARP